MVCITAAVIGGVASLGGALIQSNASQSAANTQAQAAEAGISEQQQMFGVAQNALTPYINAGSSVLPTLTQLETPGTASTTLSELPGFQFQSQYGDLAATNQLAAEGLGGSGGPLGYALSNYNQGLAQTYYSNYVNQLQQTANMGMGAGSALAGNAINAGQAISSTEQSLGSAEASGTLGSASATSSGTSSAASSVSNALLLSSLLGSGSSSLYSNALSSAMLPV